MSAAVPSPSPSSTLEDDPRPLAPKEPALEDCCGTGCTICVFDTYQMALGNHERALAAWEARHPAPSTPVPPAAA
ncbi:oxidoreductase-like domain-containing protein [Massilia sp. 9096]|uniref:oxidoreductase-like domain-containing protein n=1 Tax=Massilia sp. 9096 TaxID=1500894 RepID=UPI0005646A3B|nr:oxidoreductase-like domain-containing protein [Massilia sp. 9096]